MLESLIDWANTASADDFWQTAIFIALLSIGSFVAAFNFLIKKRIIQDIPTSRVRSAAQGYVELSGRSELIPGEAIKAPLTNTLCTWFSYEIEQYRQTGKRSGWRTIEQGESDALFLLIDDTGQAVIDPDGANITPAIKEVWYGNSRTPDPAGSRKRNWFHITGGRYRYTEERIHPADPLYAIGMFKTTGDDKGNSDINNDVRELLKEWKKDSVALLKQYDTNNDNKIDMNEWNRVREAALNQVMTRHSEMKNMPLVHMMSNTCDARRPYLLSAVAELELAKKYSLNAALCITVFFFAGILAAVLISARIAG